MQIYNIIAIKNITSAVQSVKSPVQTFNENLSGQVAVPWTSIQLAQCHETVPIAQSSL